MAQMASLLAVATVFIIGLWTLISTFYSQGKGGFYARQNYLYRNLSQKCRGGLMSVIAGFYGIHATSC